MHSGDDNKLATFLQERGIGYAAEQRESKGVRRERERNEAAQARAEYVSQWRQYVNSGGTTPAADTSSLHDVRQSVGMGAGDVADVCGIDVGTVESAEAGKATYADDALRSFIGAASTALLANRDDAKPTGK